MEVEKKMLLLFILAVGFYFYQTGDLQQFLNHNFKTNSDGGTSEARKIIDRRYASGEITMEEYNKIKGLL